MDDNRFDVREEMRKRPNEWVGVVRYSGEAHLVGFDERRFKVIDTRVLDWFSEDGIEPSFEGFLPSDVRCHYGPLPENLDAAVPYTTEVWDHQKELAAIEQFKQERRRQEEEQRAFREAAFRLSKK